LKYLIDDLWITLFLKQRTPMPVASKNGFFRAPKTNEWREEIIGSEFFTRYWPCTPTRREKSKIAIFEKLIY